MINELKKTIQNADIIVIYGAGHIGMLLHAYISMLRLDSCVAAFAISGTPDKASYLHGIPVINIYDAKKRWPDATLIVAVHTSMTSELSCMAEKAGFSTPVCFDVQELLDDFYKDLYNFPIQKNKIFFMNYNGCGYGCNPKYIAQELIRRSADVEMVWGIDEKPHYFPDAIRSVHIGTYEYYKELATAGMWIDNIRKGADIKKRKGQYYIQTWHGAAPFKKVEADLTGSVPDVVIDTAWLDSLKTDLFLSGSRFYSDLYRRAFGYDGEILESGLPRLDIFRNTKRAKREVYKAFGLGQDNMLVLYAPTFRDDGSIKAYDLDPGSVMEVVEERFGKTCVVLVSKHPLNKSIEYMMDKEKYVDASVYEDFEELLAATDVLITDYSGCVYDFSFTGNPAFLYQPDHDEMKIQRDFYVQPHQMPYPLAHDMEELIGNIQHFDGLKYKKELSGFMEQFGDFDDGHASERVCDRICTVLKGVNDIEI